MLRIKKVRDGHIIYRTNKDGWHSHFSSYQKARVCLSFIERGVMPYNDYYIESCRRLLTEGELTKLEEGIAPQWARRKKRKDRYLNQCTIQRSGSASGKW